MRRIAVLQAGTGVGKSAAYLAVGIAIALARKTRLVVSSSTVTLQEQLTFKDLPQLRAVMPHPFSFALAKGRGRYVCRTKLLRKVGRSSDESLAFDDDDVPAAERRNAAPASAPGQRIAFYRTLANALERGWEGDRDSLPESPAREDWGPVAADRHTCTVRACPEFGRCSYYKARKQLAASYVLVVNHDLLLASIGTRMLPELDGALLVLDEGHNLPKTAAEQFASALDLSRLRWLDKFPTVLGTVAAALDEAGTPGASRM
ncbi:MAG: ATP-dependent DNA helicase DinG, partial [Burkholderiales bacterium]